LDVAPSQEKQQLAITPQLAQVEKSPTRTALDDRDWQIVSWCLLNGCPGASCRRSLVRHGASRNFSVIPSGRYRFTKDSYQGRTSKARTRTPDVPASGDCTGPTSIKKSKVSSEQSPRSR